MSLVGRRLSIANITYGARKVIEDVMPLSRELVMETMDGIEKADLITLDKLLEVIEKNTLK